MNLDPQYWGDPPTQSEILKARAWHWFSPKWRSARLYLGIFREAADVWIVVQVFLAVNYGIRFFETWNWDKILISILFVSVAAARIGDNLRDVAES